jgi:hypothetical protein
MTQHNSIRYLVESPKKAWPPWAPVQRAAGSTGWKSRSARDAEYNYLTQTIVPLGIRTAG